MKSITEQLAKLEHEQWIGWSKALAMTENIHPMRIERWEKLWIPYEKLTEEQKEQDRVYARKVLEIIEKKYMMFPVVPALFKGNQKLIERENGKDKKIN